MEILSFNSILFSLSKSLIVLAKILEFTYKSPSISKLPEFSSVNLGDKFEAEVVNFLKNDNDNEHFSILLQKRSSVTEIPVDKIILTPGRFRLQAINAYDVHLSGLRAIIKVDSRPFPTLFRTFELNSLYAFIFHSILEETNDYQFL